MRVKVTPVVFLSGYDTNDEKNDQHKLVCFLLHLAPPLDTSICAQHVCQSRSIRKRNLKENPHSNWVRKLGRQVKSDGCQVAVLRLKEMAAHTRPSVSRDVDLALVEVDVLLGAKVARQRHAVEVAERGDDARILDGPHVEEQDERREQDGGQRQRDADQHQLATPVVHAHGDERQERVGQQSTRNEPITHVPNEIQYTVSPRCHREYV